MTECASLDALRQRFGRLDRRGTRLADAVLLNRSDQEKGADAIYGESLARTWAWLQALAAGGDLVDMGIDALEPHLPRDPELRDALRPPSRDEGVILPAYLDLWARTKPRPYADPDVGTYLHGVPGKDERVPDIQVVSARERGSRGVCAVLRSSVVRSSQGYGNFAPSEPAVSGS